ncbi:helix-turn-helix transcriptional regulator [Paenibacillus sp. TY11]|uniref:helix-turn-helix transcriptional regulator n=1 Tax=Paenibacillus sp. TY11 TaxID=3448633 RepID=UPI00403A3998
MALSDNFKKLRIKYDLSQQELAEIAGVTNKAVSAWETGLSEPRMGAIEKMARHFRIKKSNIIEEGGIEQIGLDQSTTIAVHFEGEDYTEEEIKEILEYAQYIKSNRK